MAVNFIETEIDGNIVKIQLDPDDFIGELPVSGVMGKIEDVVPKIQGTIHSVTKMVAKAVKESPLKPAEITVEFGVAIKAEAGILIANKSAEGQIKISLSWKES
ncbi:MAG: hypothetical protein H6655_12685 [Ardenticatenaceae bacterium]|nr:hypothetical protein [Ardenticatenaceae bacterium]